MKVAILDAAERDIVEARAFYEGREPGLGAYFVDSLFADLRSLGLYAGVHAREFGFHRMLARRFPFAVYYKVERKVARVYAVLDCRRDPAWTRTRLGQ